MRRGTIATDRLMLAYVALNSAMVVWRAGVVNAWPLLLAVNALVAVLIVLLGRSPATPLVIFLGGAYPIILTVVYYTQLGVIATDVAYVRDHLVQQWEAALFGGQVSVTWHQRWPSLAASWLLHACYGLYYLLIVAPPLWLFARASRDGFERGTFIMALAFYTCYLSFALFPVNGPRYFFGVATGPAAEVLPARLVHSLLAGGSAWGTAFPSSHVAVSWCAVLALRRDAPRLALALALVALGLAFGTVYGQFHYAVDAVAGAALAILLSAGADRLRATLVGPLGASPGAREARSTPGG